MKTTRKITVETEVVDAIFCNKCGDDCRLPKGDVWRGTPVKFVPDVGLVEITEDEARDRDALKGHTNAYGLVEATVTGGFDSVALLDMTSYTFSLCEPCLKALFDTFRHAPAESDLT